nr:hypothetical protein [Algoriphagus locisalis]
MQKIYSFSDLFSSNIPILLFDDKPFLIAQAIWQHYQPTHEIFLYKGSFKDLLKETEEVFRSNFNFITLYGESGSGKTELLDVLSKKGEQVLNLEKIANHQGSVFGNLQKIPQPSQETFLLNLAKTLSSFDIQKPIFVESEKLSLGKNIIPLTLIEKFEKGIKIRLTVSKEARIERLVSSYAGKNDAEIKRGIENLKFRIGKTLATQISTLLDKREYHQVAGMLLDYFDKADSYSSIPSQKFKLTLENLDPEATASRLIEKQT